MNLAYPITGNSVWLLLALVVRLLRAIDQFAVFLDLIGKRIPANIKVAVFKRYICHYSDGSASPCRYRVFLLGLDVCGPYPFAHPSAFGHVLYLVSVEL
jgi:hypothetical protein